MSPFQFSKDAVLRFSVPLVAKRYTHGVNSNGYNTRTALQFQFYGTITKDTDADAQVKSEGIRTFISVKILTEPNIILDINDEVVYNNQTYKITGYDKAHIVYGYMIYKANSLPSVV